MSRIRLVSWLLLFAVTCCVAPVFDSRAGAFGRCHHQQAQVCVQYVYVPVYIHKKTADDRKYPVVHFFIVTDTTDPDVGRDIALAQEKVEMLFYRLPVKHRGDIYQVPAKQLSRGKVIEDLRMFRDRVRPKDTL